MDEDERERVRQGLAEHEARVEPGGHTGRLELFRPFGPLIARVGLPLDIVCRINEHVDEFLRGHGDPPGGEGPPRIGTFDLSADFLEAGGETSLSRTFAELVVRYVDQCESPNQGIVEFERFWVVRQVEGTYSPVHFHSTDVSAVLYLKVPPSMAEAPEDSGKNHLTARQAGQITFLHGGRQPYAKSFVSFKPVEGDLILSPGWLLHAVEPFRGAGERRSLAFNASVR